MNIKKLGFYFKKAQDRIGRDSIIDRLGYPVSDIEIRIGDDDVTIECVDVIISHIARLCGVLNTRDKLAVSRKY